MAASNRPAPEIILRIMLHNTMPHFFTADPRFAYFANRMQGTRGKEMQMAYDMLTKAFMEGGFERIANVQRAAEESDLVTGQLGWEQPKENSDGKE